MKALPRSRPAKAVSTVSAQAKADYLSFIQAYDSHRDPTRVLSGNE